MQCCKQIVYLFEKYKSTVEQMKGGKQHVEMNKILCWMFKCHTFLLCLWNANQFVKSVF